MTKVANAQFGQADRVTDEFVASKSSKYYNDLKLSEARLQEGIEVDLANLHRITRAKIMRDVEKLRESGASISNSPDFYVLPQSTRDAAIHSYFNKTPVVYDAVADPGSISESAQQVKEWYAKSVGYSNDMMIPEIDMEPDYIKEGESVFGKAMTSNVSAIHAIVDNNIVMLNTDTQIIQNIFSTEANIGKVAKWDVKPPFTDPAAYFGTELQELIDSDVTLKLRHANLSFMYCNGSISKAAMEFGKTAYPSRDLMQFEILAHQIGARQLRERRMLGIDSNIQNYDFTWENHIDGLNYRGIHEIAVNASTNPNHGLCSVVSGAGLSPTATPQERAQELMGLINQVVLKMQIAGQEPTHMLIDYGTAQVLANGLTPYTRYIDPSPTRVFGVSTIQLNVLGFRPMEAIIHPWLPRKNGQSSIYLFDTRMMTRRVGWLDTLTELQPVNTLTSRFSINSAETFIDKTDVSDNCDQSLIGAVLNIAHPYNI